VATKTRSPAQAVEGGQEAGEAPAQQVEVPAGERLDEGGERGGPQQQRGRRTATLNLPFMTAQFRAPDLRGRRSGELGGAARGARSLLPSPKAVLYFGGLAAVAALEIIEWPVAVAIGVGTALASRGDLDPLPPREQASGERVGEGDVQAADARAGDGG
jgi:hypothetical protein